VNFSFCVIGADERMRYVYRHFYEKGFDVCYSDDGECPVWNSKSVIIAPPKPDYDIVKKLFDKLQDNGGVYSFFGGSLAPAFYSLGAEKNIRVYDYLEDPEVVWENAVLTARGIVAEAMKGLQGTCSLGSLVLGYGNCGKAIAEQLKKKDQRVYVAVRREDIRQEIENAGYTYVNLSKLSQFLRDFEYSYIYNTIPAMVLDKAAIDAISEKTVIYDIASAPGGTDFDYCREKGAEKGIEAYLRLGIPGRCYPDYAGAIIAGYVNRVIFEI
jgi:dipicolinate synthase subunit A